MNVEKNQIDALDWQVSISIAPEDYAASEKKRLSERRRNADFKGFRKGNAPMALIQRVYGEQALAEAVNEVISEGLNNVIKENNLRVIGEPLSSEDQPEIEWKSGNSFTFKFDIATAPELTFEIGKDDKLPRYAITVTETAKKEMKENMLRQFGSMEEGTEAGEEDFVIADLTSEAKTVEGAYISVRSVEGDAHAKFLGAKAGDKFDINVNEAFKNESDRAAMLKVKKEELSGIAPEFQVNIVNVKTFVAATESQETYDKMFGEDKVHRSEEFDAAVAEQLKANYAQEADYRLDQDLKAYFMDKASIALPEAFLRRWLIYVNDGKFTEEQIDKEFDSFLKDYRWQMIRSYVMDKYGLKVEDKDIKEAALGYASYQYMMYGMGNVPQQFLEQAAQQMLSDQNQVRRLEETVEDRKTFAALKENVTLTSKKISLEKFRELK
ncbi:MAG: hypothetical protein IJ795_06615 [Bacteroidales bacterium]|nr:hypothetical protein [Bacteroidales bacterium]